MVFNFVSDERFRRPVTTTELEEFGRSWAADNSRRKWCWVLVKQEYEENEGEGEISETKEQENKIIISTKNTNIVINYR